MTAAMPGFGYAAEPATSEYLRYQPPAPAAGTNWFSTLAYLLSLLATFAIVLGLAYVATRFLGKKIAPFYEARTGVKHVLLTVQLTPNRAIHVVEIGGKCLIVGAAEQGIAKLDEVQDPQEISRLREEAAAAVLREQGEWEVLHKQAGALRAMAERFGRNGDGTRRGK